VDSSERLYRQLFYRTETRVPQALTYRYGEIRGGAPTQHDCPKTEDGRDKPNCPAVLTFLLNYALLLPIRLS